MTTKKAFGIVLVLALIVITMSFSVAAQPPAPNEFAGTSEITVPLPPQPVTGVTIKELKGDSMKPTIIIVLLLLALLAVAAYIFRKNIKAFFTRKHHKGKKR